MDSDLHKGHRKRMREKALMTSLRGFSDHEILEFLLFYTIPRRNTNDIAHQLIKRFGSLEGLSKASVDEIAQEKFISRRTAAFIKYFPQINEQLLAADTSEAIQLCDVEIVREFVKGRYKDAPPNCIKMFCLSPSLHLIAEYDLGVGSIEELVKDPVIFLDKISEANCRGVIFSHTQPDYNFSISKHMREVLLRLSEILLHMDIRYVDHVIICGDCFPFSLQSMNLISELTELSRKLMNSGRWT